ncbi:dehydrogenase/reductase SDR family member 4-like [Belonocnema kinseyi]|uniref:dehydrogenase/reductase SDR family member 4-like n=1 Tax=Belonocnema kinseyi TaxID=2817044 RepID=UPI00143D930E|nr:dehydrogenase/reductase SDR family member 4-like [Belonocnema kinseyi]
MLTIQSKLMLKQECITKMSLVHLNKVKPACRRFEGKVAIVTASTNGIGFAIARRLAQEGACVVISSRREENVKRAVKQLCDENLKVSGLVCHVGNQEDRKRLLEEAISKFGGLHILVCSAGINPVPGQLILDCSEKVWDKTFDVNVKTTFLLIKESLPLLKKSKSSSIILISTMGGYTNNLGVYSVSKAALFALCRSIANHHTKDGVQINCIAPGLVKTNFAKFLSEDKERVTQILSRTPMNRLGLPEEIASVAAFLASEDASFLTGETITVSGGNPPSRL